MRYSFLFFLLLSLACRQSTSSPSESPAPIHDSQSITLIDPDPIIELETPEEILPAIDYDTSLWLELTSLQSSLQIDLKYATTDNFVAEKMYECGRCFLRPKVAEAVVRIQQELQQKGFGLKLLDCYRPRPIQQKLWDKVPNPSYVTPPKKGSMHNRGRAVDLTLTNSQGKELDMGTPFDFFGPRAHHTYTQLPDSILQRRLLLKGIMEENGFRSIRTEWWHYYFAEPGYALDDWLWKCGEH